MKRAVSVCVAGLVACAAFAAEPEAQSVTWTNQLGAAVSWVNTTSTRWFEGQTIVGTNCVILKSGGTAQDLTGLSVTCRVGTVTFARAVATYGTAAEASNGIFHVTLDQTATTNTSADQIIIQTEVYGTSTKVIEPWVRAYTEEPLD